MGGLRITGENACRGAFTVSGAFVGGLVGGGVAGIPTSIILGTFAFICGLVACRNSILQRAFEQQLEKFDLHKLEEAFADQAVREDGIEAFQKEAGISREHAETLWDTLCSAVLKNPAWLLNSSEYKKAAYHPATGSTKHGLSAMSYKPPKVST